MGQVDEQVDEQIHGLHAAAEAEDQLQRDRGAFPPDPRVEQAHQVRGDPDQLAIAHAGFPMPVAQIAHAAHAFHQTGQRLGRRMRGDDGHQPRVAAAMVWCEQSRAQRGIDQRGKAGQMRGFPARRRQRRQAVNMASRTGSCSFTRAAEIQDGGQAEASYRPPRPPRHGLRAQSPSVATGRAGPGPAPPGTAGRTVGNRAIGSAASSRSENAWRASVCLAALDRACTKASGSAVLAPGFAALAVEGVTLAGIQVWKDLMVGQRVGRQQFAKRGRIQALQGCTVSAMRCLPPRPAMSAAISFGTATRSAPAASHGPASG